jgi:hypothetical protein
VVELTECNYCGGYFDSDYIVAHHESYNPEKLVLICRKCHAIEHAKPNAPSRDKFLSSGGHIRKRKFNKTNEHFEKAWRHWINIGGRSLKKFRVAYAKHPEWGDL